jgi:hypothetical protein
MRFALSAAIGSRGIVDHVPAPVELKVAAIQEILAQ